MTQKSQKLQSNTVMYNSPIIKTRCAFPLFLIVLFLHLTGCSPGPEAEMLNEVPWALVSRQLIVDTHTHTRFSDGRYSVDEVVQRAISHGCDALAISDHSDLSGEAATPAYFSAISLARTKFPGLVLFGGIEWNVPPYEGREHTTVLLDPSMEEAYLGTFKELFEQDGATADRGLRWLADKIVATRNAVLIYNHPSRKDDSLDENLHDMLAWRDVNSLFIGFEGAPGHQKTHPTGSYEHRINTQDRWDPVAAEIGGVWDRLLDRGHNIWAAIAVSDFHNDDLDYSPCEFSRTHVIPEDRSARGILAGLRAGSFWADHGHILDDLLFTISVPGLSLPVTPGEVARLRSNLAVQLTVLLKRGPGARNANLVVELIGNGRSGVPEVVSSERLSPSENTINWTLTDLKPGADQRSTYFRVRIRKPEHDAPDLLAYTNPIRLVIR